MKLNAAFIEKDFWICWILEYLFCRSSISDKAAFKGGTSLSKGYGLISRMSEDVDVILDWRLLGYGLDEPWEERASKKHGEGTHFVEMASLFRRPPLLAASRLVGIIPNPFTRERLKGALRRGGWTRRNRTGDDGGGTEKKNAFSSCMKTFARYILDRKESSPVVCFPISRVVQAGEQG
jgi:hypothetical protein